MGVLRGARAVVVAAAVAAVAAWRGVARVVAWGARRLPRPRLGPPSPPVGELQYNATIGGGRGVGASAPTLLAYVPVYIFGAEGWVW